MMETTTEAFNTTTPVAVEDSYQYSWFSFAFILIFFFFCCSCIRDFLKEVCRCECRERFSPCRDCDSPCELLESCRSSQCTAVILSCLRGCVSKCSVICERLRACISDNNNVNSDVEVASSSPVTISSQFSEMVEHRTDNIDENPPMDEVPPPSYDSIVSNPSQPPPSYEEAMR